MEVVRGGGGGGGGGSEDEAVEGGDRRETPDGIDVVRLRETVDLDLRSFRVESGH